MQKQPAVYILTNKKKGTLYIGVTSDLIKRVYQHRAHAVDGFSNQYNTTRLVYFETCDEILTAIAREKQLKKWNRAWKIELIEESNPEWRDLYEDII
jgi:putative endonuclease